ncbi:MAG TPA: cell division protein ZapA [Hypericibacter adhaerens]|jgi:cell division protein ZapA|uniref:Cell division protein ZapA n=1 Tax=Hypericibacter adhaerens TaxID=2602016 RepID=A0A5J6N208_9PROT|nr:cell division protein ZapA [Hypericibacter adhaerens]QEX24008.1 cell division protein ZapA [Hypericibacter adhaerens]HWA44785.1 cell division protein ZapA [Hypericibacter adhaerens]
MATVTLSLNGRPYEIACDDGQEERLQTLGIDLDRRVSEMARRLGPVADNRLLAMAALVIADELATARAAADASVQRAAERDAAAAADAVEAMARRMDAIATRLSAP